MRISDWISDVCSSDLVTGGSQGASVLSKVVPDGLSMLPVAFRRRLQVTHQARIEDIDDARAKYAELSIAAALATYLPDMPEQLAWTHTVIARAGAPAAAAPPPKRQSVVKGKRVS